MNAQSYGDALCAAREREIDADEAYAARFERLANQEEKRLTIEFTQACEVGSGSILETPAWGHCRSAKLREVFDDLCSGKNDYQDKVLDLIALCMKSSDMGVRFTSQVLIARMSLEYGKFHADDAATEKLA